MGAVDAKGSIKHCQTRLPCGGRKEATLAVGETWYLAVSSGCPSATSIFTLCTTGNWESMGTNRPSKVMLKGCGQTRLLPELVPRFLEFPTGFLDGPQGRVSRGSREVLGRVYHSGQKY